MNCYGLFGPGSRDMYDLQADWIQVSVLGRCPLSVLVNFIVNLRLGNYLTTILEETVFKKEEGLLQRGRHLLWQNGFAVEVIYPNPQ